jgi:hypothetical protein
MAAKTPARKHDDVTSRKRDDDTPAKGPGSPARFKGNPRGPARSSKVHDLTKAMKVAKRVGGVARVELLPDGRIQMILAGQDHPIAQAGDDLDKWMAEKNARQA